MKSGMSATNVESIKNAKKNLTSFLKKQQVLPSEIMSREAPRIQAEAKLLTPFESGRLEHNVRCQVSKSIYRPGINISASARHNGYNYAAIQHENESYKHPIKGQAHFLLLPFNKGVDRIKRAMKKEITYNGGSN